MSQNKRFVNIGKDIMLDGEVWCTAGDEHCADVIATALNTLFEENKELAKERDILFELLINTESQLIEEYSSTITEDYKELNKIEEENDIKALIRFCSESYSQIKYFENEYGVKIL